MLPPELSTLLDADHDARARISAATAAARERIEEARAARERRRGERIEALERQLAAELAAIESGAEEQAAERRARRAAFLDGQRRAGDAVLSSAAELYAQIVRHGPQRTARAAP